MSYQVMARKWRSQTFDQLIGQEHVTQTLRNALRNERLPHALLFTGTRGVGKTSAARILAKSLLCPNGVDFVPCNECSTCVEITSGSNLDVSEIDGASNNGVEAVRELIEKVGYMPSAGKYKVYIIDEVHMLSTSAFNALLKTLEEPPAHVKFIFATTEVHKIPNTILSRCQRFDFRRIPTRMISEHLGKICQSEGVEFEPEALWIVARQGDGSMRDSQSLLDQVITFSGGLVSQLKVIEVLGLTDRAIIVDTLSAIVARDGQKGLSIVERIYQSGYDSKVFVNELLEEIRHLLFVKEVTTDISRYVDLPDSEIASLQSLADSLSREDIHLIFDMALKGAQEVPKAEDPRLVLEMLILRMVNAPKIVDILSLSRVGATMSTGAMEKKKTSLETKPIPNAAKKATPLQNLPPTKQTAPVTPLAPKAETPTVKAPVVVKPLNPATWVDFVSHLKSDSPVMGAQIENLSLIEVKNKNADLGLRKQQEFLINQLQSEKALKELTEKAKEFFGTDHSFQIKVLELDNKAAAAITTPREIVAKMEVDRKAEVRLKVENHPLIVKAANVLGAKIKEIKEYKL